MIGFDDGSGISWTICKQSAPHSKQITTTNTSLLNFCRPDALPDALTLLVEHQLNQQCQSTSECVSNQGARIYKISYDSLTTNCKIFCKWVR